MNQKHGQCSKRKEKGSRLLRHGAGEEHRKFPEQIELKMKKYTFKWTNGKYHIIRNNEWITTILEGKIKRKAGIGRPRIPFMKQIIEDRKNQL